MAVNFLQFWAWSIKPFKRSCCRKMVTYRRTYGMTGSNYRPLLKFLLPKNVWVSFFYLCMASEYGEGFISHAQTYMHKIHLTLWCYTQKKTGEFKNGAVWCYPYSCQILYFVQIYIKIMIIFSINEFSEKPNHKF